MIEINVNNFYKNTEKDLFFCNFSGERSYVLPTRVKVSKVDTVVDRYRKNQENYDEFDNSYYYFKITAPNDNNIVYWTNMKDLKGSVKLFETYKECLETFKEQIKKYFKNNVKYYKINDFPTTIDEINLKNISNRIELVLTLNRFADEKVEEKIKKTINDLCYSVLPKP
jgi:hypothetical protein